MLEDQDTRDQRPFVVLCVILGLVFFVAAGIIVGLVMNDNTKTAIILHLNGDLNTAKQETRFAECEAAYATTAAIAFMSLANGKMTMRDVKDVVEAAAADREKDCPLGRRS